MGNKFYIVTDIFCTKCLVLANREIALVVAEKAFFPSIRLNGAAIISKTQFFEIILIDISLQMLIRKFRIQKQSDLLLGNPQHPERFLFFPNKMNFIQIFIVLSSC